MSGHSQRFPSLECEAYPRDLLVDLFVVQESFYFGLRKAVTSQLPSLVVTLCLSFPEVFVPSFCDVFVWRSLPGAASTRPGGASIRLEALYVLV